MNALQHTLMDLRVQITTLQQLTEGDAQQAKEPPAGVRAGLLRTLEELQSIAATLRQEQQEASNGAAGGNGKSSIDTAPPKLARRVGPHTERRIPERQVARYQTRLRSLLAELLMVEESERQRLAVDLHDGLSQTIALTQIKLTALRQSLDGKLSEACDEIGQLIQEADRATRSISSELSPLVLHDLGLEPAVQWLVESIRSRYGIEIALEDDGEPKSADEQTRVILFRSIRELLINAAKHAGAQRVHVRLQRVEGQLSALVEDDGVGMEPWAAVAQGSGLFSIQERLAHVGGRMRIRSTPGQGTKISLFAPLTDNNTPKARLQT